MEVVLDLLKNGSQVTKKLMVVGNFSGDRKSVVGTYSCDEQMCIWWWSVAVLKQTHFADLSSQKMIVVGVIDPFKPEYTVVIAIAAGGSINDQCSIWEWWSSWKARYSWSLKVCFWIFIEMSISLSCISNRHNHISIHIFIQDFHFSSMWLFSP